MRRAPPILLALTSALWLGCAHAPKTDSGPVHHPVAILTDYGSRDEYVGILKGAILSIDPAARIFDTTNDVPPFDIGEGEYLLSLVAPEFPTGTVFLAVVDPGVGSSRRAIALQTSNDMWFVGPDNGLFTGVIEKYGVRQVLEITKPPTGRPRSDTFHGRELFAPAAALIAMGRDPATFAEPTNTAPTQLPRTPARFENGELRGQIVHVDYYGNAITNIPRDLCEKAALAFGGEVSVTAGGATSVMRYTRTYSDVPEGSLVAVNNSRNLLEFAINMGDAGKALKLKAGQQVRARAVRP